MAMRVGLILGLLLYGCRTSGDPSDGGPADANRTEAAPPANGDARDTPSSADVASSHTQKLDVLFVIDNSPSMVTKQQALSRSFPAFFEALGKAKGGAPDLRLGIVSTDLGAGSLVIANCDRPGGDRASLQVKTGCGVNAPDRYLASPRTGQPNFTGNIADVFACMSALGAIGCGYEHQLAAARLALVPQSNVQSENAGFVRSDAHLAIIFLTDEDDCSANPSSDLFSNPVDFPDQAPSLRCALAGHLCNGMAPPAAVFTTPLAACTANPGGKLIPVSEIVSDIKTLKRQGPQRILVGALAGWDPSPEARYRIGRTRLPEELSYLPACASPGIGESTPAIRIKAFVDAFGSDGALYPLCSDDLGPALRDFGTKVAALFAD